jgi:hypothetical protein
MIKSTMLFNMCPFPCQNPTSNAQCKYCLFAIHDSPSVDYSYVQSLPLAPPLAHGLVSSSTGLCTLNCPPSALLVLWYYSYLNIFEYIPFVMGLACHLAQ